MGRWGGARRPRPRANRYDPAVDICQHVHGGKVDEQRRRREARHGGEAETHHGDRCAVLRGERMGLGNCKSLRPPLFMRGLFSPFLPAGGGAMARAEDSTAETGRRKRLERAKGQVGRFVTHRPEAQRLVDRTVEGGVGRCRRITRRRLVRTRPPCRPRWAPPSRRPSQSWTALGSGGSSSAHRAASSRRDPRPGGSCNDTRRESTRGGRGCQRTAPDEGGPRPRAPNHHGVDDHVIDVEEAGGDEVRQEGGELWRVGREESYGALIA